MRKAETQNLNLIKYHSGTTKVIWGIQINPTINATVKIEAALHNYRTISGERQWFNTDGSTWTTGSQGTEVRFACF